MMMITKLIKQLCIGGSKDLPILKERDATPSHYLLNIESASELSENMIKNFISNMFEAGGYKWSLQIYLNGDIDNEGEGYISMYLELADTPDLPLGFEVNALFNFFIHNTIQDKYLCLQDAREKRFHSINSRWGITKFIDLKTFKNPSKGYLINDKCTFGAEVFIIKNTCKGDSLTMISEPDLNCTYTWTFDDFSRKIGDEWYRSDSFIGGDYKWRIMLNPKGYAYSAEGISVGLELDTSVLPDNTKLLANYVLRVVDQTEKEDHYGVEGTATFFSSSYGDGVSSSAEDTDGFIVSDFMSLTRLQDPKMGFLLKDKCIIEAEINILAINGPHALFYS